MSDLRFKVGDRVKIQYGKSRHLIWQKMFLGKFGTVEAVGTGTLCYKLSCCAHWLAADEVCSPEDTMNYELPPMAVVNPGGSGHITYVSTTTPRKPSFENIDSLFKITRTTA